MKRSSEDLIFGVVVILLIAPFLLFKQMQELYFTMNHAHPFWMAFMKFAILATIGEILAYRTRTGGYPPKSYGIAPRAIVWGIFGVWIAIAMKCFSIGAPAAAEGLGFNGVVSAMSGSFTFEKFIGAFSISLAMNSCFAPLFMTMHKITDTHIAECGGSLRSLITPIPMKRIISELDWKTQWSFVFKKSIPLFWIPAHVVTFLLPVSSQVLFAAILSIALGLLLSIAALLSRK